MADVTEGPSEVTEVVQHAPLNVGARTGMQTLSAEGRALVEKKRELSTMSRMFEGMEWGNVRGSSLSPATRYALADFCYMTRANPQLHVDILGGKPYLNAYYYADRCNTDPAFIRYVQVNVTPGIETSYREQANQAIADAKLLEEVGDAEGANEARRHAAQLFFNARRAAAARAEYGVPDKAQAAFETIIYRYVNGAPVQQILAGEVDPEPYIKEVRECNWAGVGDAKDPIGNADPQPTARTRSFRRCARYAFPAWMDSLEKEIAQREKEIQANWRLVEEDEQQARAALPAAGEGQAVRASGEPEAARQEDARDLPTFGQDAELDRVFGTEAEPAAPATSAAPSGPAPAWDRNDARKRLFATLRDAGIKEGDRKAWQAEHGLPESTSEWTEADYGRAVQILVDPTVRAVHEAAVFVGVDDVLGWATEKLGHEPDTLRDWQTVRSHLNALADAPAQQELV